MVSLLRNFVVSLQAILAQPLIFIRFPPYVRFYLAMVFLYMTVLVAFLYALLAYPFFSAFGRRSFLQYTIGRLWWHIQAPIFRLCIVVEGEENMLRWVGGRESGGPCIFVANHQSELDLLIMAKLWPPYTVTCATWRVKRLPVLGQILGICRTIFVDPPLSCGLTNGQILLSAARTMREEGINVWIFPEGVLNPSTKPELLPFKRGTFYLALDAGEVPIVPIVIANSAYIFHEPTRTFPGGTVRVRVLPPISSKAKEGESREETVSRLMDHTRNATLEALERISVN